MLLFRPALMSLSIFVSAEAVSVVFGQSHRLGSDLGELAMAVALLGAIHFIINCGVMSAHKPVGDGSEVVPVVKGRVACTGLSYAG